MLCRSIVFIKNDVIVVNETPVHHDDNDDNDTYHVSVKYTIICYNSNPYSQIHLVQLLQHVHY